MNADIRIRPAEAGDLDAVQRIVDDAYAPYIARIGRKPGPMLDDYADLIDGGNVTVLEHDGAVKGLLVLMLEGDGMLLDNIAIHPAAQGMGFGGRLMRLAEETAREAGCAAIRLYTNEAMTENIAIYQRAGYLETHRGEEKGLRRVYMTKALR